MRLGFKIPTIFLKPQGLFGFSEIRTMELFFDKEELPFMWLREKDDKGLAFIVIEPGAA